MIRGCPQELWTSMEDTGHSTVSLDYPRERVLDLNIIKLLIFEAMPLDDRTIKYGQTKLTSSSLYRGFLAAVQWRRWTNTVQQYSRQKWHKETRSLYLIMTTFLAWKTNNQPQGLPTKARPINNSQSTLSTSHTAYTHTHTNPAVQQSCHHLRGQAESKDY